MASGTSKDKLCTRKFDLPYGVGEWFRPLDASSSSVLYDESVIHGSVVSPEGDVPRPQVYAGSGGLEWPPTSVDLVRIVSEQRQMCGVTPRWNAGRDCVHLTRDAAPRDFIHVWFSRGFERRAISKRRDWTIRHAVADEQDCLQVQPLQR